MELNEALLQISAIRQQMARTEQFRGYRAAPVAFSGFLAFAAGGLQAVLIDDPHREFWRYLTLWVAVAVVSAAVCFFDVWRRYRRIPGRLHHETTQLALEQFFPCVIVGGLLTIAISRTHPQSAELLPGLWAILFSMGLFASWRLLPRATFAVAIYYLFGGLFAIATDHGRHGLAPWMMPLLFGVGQCLSAGVLFLSEREQTANEKR